MSCQGDCKGIEALERRGGDMLRYIRVTRMSIQTSLQFRGHYLINLFNTIGLVPMLLFWQIILQDDNIGSYNTDLMLTYATMSSVIQMLFSTSVGGDICAEIRDGALTAYLVEPINHLIRHFSMFMGKLIGESLPKSILQVSVVILIVQLMGFEMKFQPSTMVWFLLLLAEGILVSFLVNLIFGLIGFWLTESSTFFMLIQAITNILAGSGIPLDVLPWGLDSILIHTPFAYMVYYPIKAGIGQLDHLYAVSGQGLIWIGVLLLIVILTWRQGLHRYSAPGG